MNTIDQNIHAINEVQKGNYQAASQFTGFGGLRRSLTPAHQARLRALLKPNEITGVMRSLSTGYFTPPLLVKFIWAFVRQLGFQGGNILEPACGTGRFFEFMPQALRDCSQITGIEVDPLSAKIARALFPDVTILNQGFETSNVNGFDLIIGNPPYSSQHVHDACHRDLSGAIHHYFVAKSARLLNANGLLAMVLPTYVLDNVKHHLRDKIAQCVNLVAAYRLPDTLFEHAKVTIDVAFFRQSSHLDKQWMRTESVQVDEAHTFPISSYFVEHPEHILGQLGHYRCWLKSEQRERVGLCCRSSYEATKVKLKGILEGERSKQKHEPIMAQLKCLRANLDDLIGQLQ